MPSPERLARTLPIAALFALAACATSTKTFGPDGKVAHSINCRGAANSWGSCYEEAGSICGAKGYEVVARNGEVTQFGMMNGYAHAAGGSVTGFGGAAISRNLLVQCKS